MVTLIKKGGFLKTSTLFKGDFKDKLKKYNAEIIEQQWYSKRIQ